MSRNPRNPLGAGLAFLPPTENTFPTDSASSISSSSTIEAHSSNSSSNPLREHAQKRRESIELNAQHGSGLNTDDEDEALLLLREARQRKVLEKKRKASDGKDIQELRRKEEEYRKASALAAGDPIRMDIEDRDEELQSSYSDDQISNISSVISSAATSDLNYSLLSNENDTSSIRRRKRQRREERPPPIEIKNIVESKKKQATRKSHAGKERSHRKDARRKTNRATARDGTTTKVSLEAHSRTGQPALTIEQRHESGMPSTPTAVSTFYSRMLNFVLVLNPYGKIYSTRLEYQKEGRKNFVDFSRKVSLFLMVSMGVRLLGYYLHKTMTRGQEGSGEIAALAQA